MNTEPDEDFDDGLTQPEVRAIMAHFEAQDCSTRILDDDACFEFENTELPATTHVFATPYFLQLTTFLSAIGPSGEKSDIPLRDSYLNAANQSTSIIKLTCDSDKIDRRLCGWRIKAEARLALGDICRSYTEPQIKALTSLWMYDLAVLLNFTHSISTKLYKKGA